LEVRSGTLNDPDAASPWSLRHSQQESHLRGWSRKYLVTLQQLSELEEILTYQRLVAAGNAPAAATYLQHLREMWRSRLLGCSENVDVWNRILSVRSIIVGATEDIESWLQLLTLQEGRSA